MSDGYTIRLEPAIKKMGDYSFTGVIDAYFYPDIEIGKFSSIASPFYAHGATEHPNVFNKDLVSNFPFGDKWNVNYPKAQSKGKIEIGSDVWIGESVTVLSGVKIGDGAIIGARTVVARDIPPFAIAIGNPAQVLRFRFTSDVIEKLLKIRWWNWPKDRIEESMELMKDINKFIEKYDS